MSVHVLKPLWNQTSELNPKGYLYVPLMLSQRMFYCHLLVHCHMNLTEMNRLIIVLHM